MIEAKTKLYLIDRLAELQAAAPSIRDFGYAGADSNQEISEWMEKAHFYGIPRWEICHGTSRLVFWKCWEGIEKEGWELQNNAPYFFSLKPIAEIEKTLGDLF